MSPNTLDNRDFWPALPLNAWEDTRATLHMWTQIVGKTRLAVTPLVNHWWNVPLYVTPHGLTTSLMPYRGGAFEIWFDFIQHQLVLRTSAGSGGTIPLKPRSVADFYAEYTRLLRSSGIEVNIWKMPVEIPSPIPFDQDSVHAFYDPEYVQRFWRILVTVHSVFEEFRARFIGKCSPVHFFWGSFDLAVTRFSGRRAPERTGADRITKEAYSHEVSSVGFWPGSGTVRNPAFYSYAAPEPKGFGDARVEPDPGFYDKQLGEFLLMYDDVRSLTEPSAALRSFCHSAYVAAADLAAWDRPSLEREGRNIVPEKSSR